MSRDAVVGAVRALGVDGLLLVGDSVCDADIYYASRFLSSDRFAVLITDRIHLLVSSMERARASSESKADVVETTSDYSMKSRIEEFGSADKAYIKVLEEFVSKHGISHLGIPSNTPAGIYRSLTEQFETSLLDKPFEHIRAVKTPEEISAIAEVQEACESAMEVAVSLIKKSKPTGGILVFDGKPLTSERVRSAVELRLAELGCETLDTIVCGGLMSSSPHSRGSGLLPADMPIVIDIFPRSKSSRYFADMTRTVVRGEPSVEIVEMYQAVKIAQEAGLKCIKEGVSGADVHGAVCRTFDDFGYTEREECGFIHSTGHGVGLSIHERPSLSEHGGTLRSGNVVTVEPGLYYPDIGGVRLEDLVVVRENGCENLTAFEKELVIR
ncbi:MAG: aminopeptidase P family protein [Methanothrix sp.]|jgi:Xaa-Pro aminopeptidase|uniref:Peptidase M24 n=1 Tax=Methanothrix thermoacetophila (strain DSM 6194 / JCM 14653 / NBRC 101360 / PT) TaxID=349307 RepID=A0B8J4_METTP|nr:MULTISPECIES: Xaa-Pro peptidase family protein [Methanothrix]ABK15018.1 peptidase M24 [Methanothrix thermoacetophila PT]MBC7079400.1 aminopeptidase P family protein [Methanothrix sp.]NPU86867.1 aminopeptidase P family protein [Methanothrix sp.]